jgi:hypothetical protein
MNVGNSRDLTLHKQFYRLHIRLTRKINDTHIFLQSAMPSLRQIQKTLTKSTHKKDRRYYTPKLNRKVFSRRRDSEVAAIFDRFVQVELYETLVVAAVSQFEAFLGDVISTILETYPKKLSVVPEVEKDKDQRPKDVSLEVILRSGSYAEIIDSVIEARCEALFFAPPKNTLNIWRKSQE